MKRIFSILFALALVLGFSLVATMPVAAASTWYVDGTLGTDDGSHGAGSGASAFKTIQYSINDSRVGNGDTIEVAAGTYHEKVYVRKSVTLRGAQAGVDARGRTAVPESIINPNQAYVVVVQADNVIIDGFEITSTVNSNGDNAGIYVSDKIGELGEGGTELNNIVVRNCGIHNLTDGLRTGGQGIHGIVVGPKTDGVELAYNEIYNLRMIDDDGSYAPVGVMIWGNAGEEAKNTHVHYNLIHDIANDDSAVQPRGIMSSVGADTTVIEHNEIYNVARGVSISSVALGTHAARNNYVHNCIYGLRFFAAGTNATCNILTANQWGIHVTASAANIHVDANSNSIYGNTGYGILAVANSGYTVSVDAENNWWGDDSGPSGVGPGTGDAVSSNVDFTPWIDTTVTTATATGTASFATSDGNILGLTAVTPPATPPVTLPHGMFNFTVCCFTGPTVTLNITFPRPIPVGYKWWKYVGGSWYSLPIGSNDGDNFITVTLRDNVLPDDEDTIAGQITDQGGPGEPGAVGWETYPINKVRVFLPWIALFAAIAAGVSLLVLKRRRAHS